VRVGVAGSGGGVVVVVVVKTSLNLFCVFSAASCLNPDIVIRFQLLILGQIRQSQTIVSILLISDLKYSKEFNDETLTL